MDDDARQQAFMSALVTEHFVQQSAASATISESSSRSSLYLLSLSSGLVALGFASQASERAFGPFAAAVLPTLFVLGCFTVVRLVDTSIENVQSLRSIAKIRQYYARLTPEAAEYFPSTGDTATDAQWMLGTAYSRWLTLFTMASMIGVVNAVLGGTLVAMALRGLLGVSLWVSVGVAAVIALGLVFAVLRYVRARFTAALSAAPARPTPSSSSTTDRSTPAR